MDLPKVSTRCDEELMPFFCDRKEWLEAVKKVKKPIQGETPRIGLCFGAR
jgi:hypothetical protein